jgi:excisionase family DNA binding protein
MDDKTATLESLLRELVTPIIRDAVNQALEQYQSASDAHPLSVKEILTVEETATFLGVKKSWVYKMSHYKVVPHYTTGKRVYFKREDLLQWVMKNRIGSHEEIEQQALNYIVRNRRKY